MGELVKRIVTLICFTLLVASPLGLIRAPFDPFTDVVVPRLEEPVSVDGNIGMWEWSDAVKISVTFRFWNETTGEYVENRTGGISLKHDCAYLYILISIQDSPNNTDSWSTIFYDSDRDGTIPEDGDDDKSIVHPDTAMDVALVDSGWDYDTELGGTNDLTGASGYTPVENLMYEFKHPLDSGDSAGNDPSAPPGSTISAMFTAGDPEVTDADYALAYTDEWKYIFNLQITPCEPAVGGTINPTNPWLIARPLIAIAIIAITGYLGLMNKREVAT